jgi:hypothetical protein
MAFTRSIAVSTIALALVAACGGGGGDSAPAGVTVPQAVRGGSASAGADISAANAASFAGVLARAVMSATDGDVPGISGSRESPQARSGSANGGANGGVRWLGQAANVAARKIAAQRDAAQATTTQTVACDVSGSLTVTVNDADGSRSLSAGDTASFQFQACIFVVGDPAASGSFSFTVNAVELDAQNVPTALDASLTLAGFTEAGFGSLSGSFRLWFKGEGASNVRQRISYLNTAVIEAGQALAYNFDAYGVAGDGGGSFDLNGALGIGGQSYAVSSTVFTHGQNALPASGALTLRDAAGDAVILRARSATTFDLEFQATGAAAPTVLASGLLWNSYRLSGN